ncbi:hypothetical protein [Lacticaseibacillus jixiensis]|uniref:hypothetical protein n=1 Tax=Lacticaseibacillus jixiensis TaxID=3231926 RepID=UPI0036F23169
MKIDRSILNQPWPVPGDASYPPSDRKRFEECDSPVALSRLDMFDQLLLLNWCCKLKQRKVFNLQQSSYNLKHHFEQVSGVYVSNGAFKAAMLLVGFKAKDVGDLNWHFNVTHVK